MTDAHDLFNLSDDAEYWRLRRFEESYDPPTLRRLDDIGVAPGWQCLEVAAGTGSVALALQARAGSVTALDRDARFIRRYESPAFVVIERGVEVAELPRQLDLVHVRFLLDLLDNPRGIVHKFASLLRPGGYLFIEEFDDVTIESASGNPDAMALHALVLEAKQEAWRQRGHENHLGRQLPNWFIELGLIDVDAECGCRIRRSGTGDTFAWKQSLLGVRNAVIDAGLPESAFDEYLSVLDSPGFSFFSPLVVRSLGRVAK